MSKQTWAEFIAANPIPATDYRTKNMWGKLFRDAADAGNIRRAWPNYVPSPRPARKGGVCAQWKAAA